MTPLAWGGIRWVIDLVFFWEDSHCRESYFSELTRRHLPPAYRDMLDNRTDWEHG